MNEKSLLKSFIGFLMGPLLGAIIGFFTTIITSWLLNPNEIGKASTTTVFITITSLFIYFGLDQAFIREYNEVKNKKELFWNAVYIPLILSIVISLLSAIYFKKLSILLFKEINITSTFMLIIALPFFIIDRYSMLVLRMNEKAKLYSCLQILNKIFNVGILTIYLLFIEKTYVSIVFSMSLSIIITAIIGIFVTKEYWIIRININKRLMFKLIRFGLPLVPAMIITSIFTSMDKIALVAWSNFEQVGIYTTAFKITVMLSLIQAAFSTFWAPVSQKWFAEKVENSKIIEVSYIMCSLVSIIYLFIVLFKDIIIRVLLPVSYRDAAALIPFLAYVPLMSLLSLTTCIGINFSRRTEYNIIPSLIALIINYILNKLFIPIMGALGAAIASAISYTVYFIVITYISRRLWYKFKVKNIAINLIAISLVSINMIHLNSIILSIIISIFIIGFNYKYYKYVFNIVKENLFLKNKCKQD